MLLQLIFGMNIFKNIQKFNFIKKKMISIKSNTKKLSSYNKIDDNGIKVLAKSLQDLQNLISLNIDLRFEIINKKLQDFTLI